MVKEPEGGAIGTAQFRSYTNLLTMVANLELLTFTSFDQVQDGPHFLNVAFGLQSSIWIWVCMIAGWMIGLFGANIVSPIYTEFTGLYYTQDRLGFAKSGGQDIGSWCSLFSFVFTLYIFARFVPAGILGVFRPFVVLIITGVLAYIMTQFIARRVFSALYKPHRPKSFYGRYIRCQQTYLRNQGCQNVTYRQEDWCRWHKILHDFRADNANRRDWAIRSHMIGVGVAFSIATICLWFYSKTPEFIWLPMSVFAIGSGFTWFADAIMAMTSDYPLSEFAFWAKLLTIGMLLEVIGGIALIVYVFNNAQGALPLLTFILGNNPFWLTYGPPLLILVIALFTTTPVRLLIERVLFWHVPYLGTFLWICVFIFVGWAFQPLLLKLTFFNSISPQANDSFWQAVLGHGNIWLPIGIAYVVAFFLCEFINAGTRRSKLSEEDFKKTIWSSYPACGLPPVLALLASRYLLFWLGIVGAIPFVILTIVIAIPLCIIGTRLVIRPYIRPPRQLHLH